MKKIFSRINIINTKRNSLLVLIIFLVGIFIRTYNISNYPAGLNQDEASIGYEAFSILNNGYDRNGNSLPVHLVSWGNGQNALYAYLSMPFVKFWGLNTFSVRIVNSLFSILSMLLFYLIFRLFSNKKMALFALFFFAISPWSIMSARWGLESNIFPAVFLLAVFFLIKGIISSSKYFPLSFFVFAISLYSYGTSYFVVPLFFLFTIPYLLHTKKITLKNLILSISIFLFISWPIILFVIINQFSLPQIDFLGVTIPRLTESRTNVIFNIITPHFFSVLLKNIIRFSSILILQTDGNYYNSIPSFGTIYPISFLFFIIGLFHSLKRTFLLNNPIHYIFLIWLFCSFILGFTTHTNINRLNIIFPPLLYFAVFGIFYSYNYLKTKHKQQYQLLIIGIYSILFFLFTGYYFVFSIEKSKEDFSYGLGNAIEYSEKTKPKIPINITTNCVNMPYIYVCFYNKLNPELFRKTVVYEDNNAGFREVKKLGRYKFSPMDYSKNVINIVSNKDLEYIHDFVLLTKSGNYSVIQFQ